jgi:hypothetical protein
MDKLYKIFASTTWKHTSLQLGKKLTIILYCIKSLIYQVTISHKLL